MRSRPLHTDLLRRLLAAGMTALVLALTVFAASPVAHDSLHHGDGAPADDRCAVELFASSTAVPLAEIEVLPPATAWCAPAAIVAGEISLTSPRYLRQPERGPPALG